MWEINITYILQYLGVILCSFLLGAFVVVGIVVYLVHQYTKHLPRGKGTINFGYEKVAYGELLHQSLHGAMQTSVPGQKESCNFINLLLLFLFREWRDTTQLQRWVLKKINIEIQEFMDTKAASRLLHGIKIHDLSLGKNFPVFHNAVIKEPLAFSDCQPPEKIVVDFDMEYSGGLRLAVDVDLAFGKSAFLAVCVSFLKGRVRLIFNRSPCTHWSIAFVNEPEIKFDIETSFENLQLPQVASLIVNQIKRTIRRKHTIPYYKLRYNPLFSFQHPEKSEFDGFVENITMQPSILEISVDACTRLLAVSKTEKDHSSSNHVVFCTLSVDEISCVETPLFKNNLPNEEDIALEAGDSLDASQEKLPSKSSFSLKSNLTEFQKSLLSLRKPTNDNQHVKARSRSASPSLKHKKDEKLNNKEQDEATASNTYLMVMPSFTATLREETDGEKQMVVISNISSQESGLSQGDEIVSINKEEIYSLSHAIVVVSKIRASNEPFTFRVKRHQIKRSVSNKSLNKETFRDRLLRDEEVETDSDHSDVEINDEVNNELVRIGAETSTYHRFAVGDDDLPHSSHTHSNGTPMDATPYMTLSASDYPATKVKEIKVANNSRTPSPKPRKAKQHSEKKKNDKSKIEVPPRKHTKERSSSLVLPELLSEEAYRISSAFCDLSDQPMPFPIPSRPGESLQFARVTNNANTQLFKTSLSQYDGNSELSWKSETFLFNIKEGHRYLNIRLWTQKVCQSSIATDKPPQVVGCLSIPLCDLELICSSVSSHRATQRYRVNAPKELPPSHKWYMGCDFSQRSSFRDQYCHGDVVLTTRLVPLSDGELNNNNNNNNQKNHEKEVENDCSSQQAEDEEYDKEEESEESRHEYSSADFKITEHLFELFENHSRFTKHHRCEFCGKKIWLKSVMKCQLCGKIFHPNCASKVKDELLCEHESTNEQQPQPSQDSTNAEPNNNTTNNTQQRSEKFSKTSEDLLAVQAKDCGRDLHRDLPTNERRLMLEKLLIKVENELHTEIVDKENLLTEQCSIKQRSHDWKVLEKQIVKSDEKLQSLALLMIYYKSGLEDCNGNDGTDVCDHPASTQQMKS